MERCTSDTKVSSHVGAAYFVRLGKHGVIYFRHKSFISIHTKVSSHVGAAYFVRLGKHGVIYFRHKSFISILKLLIF